METRTLGTSDLAVSVVGLGCNNLGRPGTFTFDQAGTDAVVHAALDAGVNFFDTADVYGAEYGLSETRLGAALRGRRDEAIVATKFGHASMPSPLGDVGPKGGRAYIRAAVEGSLWHAQHDLVRMASPTALGAHEVLPAWSPKQKQLLVERLDDVLVHWALPLPVSCVSRSGR